MTFLGKLSDFRVKKKSCIESIAVYIHPKNSNHLRSHLRAIMALGHSRLGLENEFLENKSGRIFCVRQDHLTKSCQQLWVRVNQHFILYIHHTWGETVIWGAVFIIQTSDKMQYFTIFQDKLHLFNIQNRTKHTWAFFTLQHNKEFSVFIFLFNGFITMCNLKKRLIREAFWVLLQAMFTNDWKQTAKRLKLQETTNNQ